MGTGHDRYRKAAVMRSVSKEWLLAFGECPGSTIQIEWRDSADLARLCNVAPSMSFITLCSMGEPLILRPLSACTHLETVIIRGFLGLAPPLSAHTHLERVIIRGFLGLAPVEDSAAMDVIHIDLNGLPDSVMKIEIRIATPFALDGLETFTCPNLKHLLICWSRSEHENDLQRLLQCLPGLQVIIRALAKDHASRGGFFRPILGIC